MAPVDQAARSFAPPDAKTRSGGSVAVGVGTANKLGKTAARTARLHRRGPLALTPDWSTAVARMPVAGGATDLK
jgi:hypothetical protein